MVYIRCWKFKDRRHHQPMPERQLNLQLPVSYQRGHFPKYLLALASIPGNNTKDWEDKEMEPFPAWHEKHFFPPAKGHESLMSKAFLPMVNPLRKCQNWFVQPRTPTKGPMRWLHYIRQKKNNKIVFINHIGPQPNLIYSSACRRRETGKRWNVTFPTSY